MLYTIDLQKAVRTETADGRLTKVGQRVAAQYAQAWLRGQRNLELERQYPDLSGLFYDLRTDVKLCRLYAAEK